MSDDHERKVIHRELDTDAESPATQIVETVADIEATEMTELSAIWCCVDGVLDDLFSDPPAPEAQMEIEFSYEGYRITIEQNGNAAFVETT